MKKRLQQPAGGQAVDSGIATIPELVRSDKSPGHSSIELQTAPATSEAAQILVEHLFAQSDSNIPGISYAVIYRLAEGHAGGDIIDVYHFDNDSVALSIADISGKGTQAAIHAALIKYGLRAYSSHGLNPEKVVRALDRLYLENNTFERTESFASLFLGIIDPTRRMMSYASAAHEPVIILQPGESARTLATTAPLIGVFDDQHHLFKQHFVELTKGSLFVATTDGVTEARNPMGEFYGMDRLLRLVEAHRNSSEVEIVNAILADAEAFCHGPRRDDIAVIAARIS